MWHKSQGFSESAPPNRLEKIGLKNDPTSSPPTKCYLSRPALPFCFLGVFKDSQPLLKAGCQPWPDSQEKFSPLALAVSLGGAPRTMGFATPRRAPTADPERAVAWLAGERGKEHKRADVARAIAAIAVPAGGGEWKLQSVRLRVE